MMVMISASSLQTVRNESLLLTSPACGTVTAAPAKECTSDIQAFSWKCTGPSHVLL